MKRKGLLRNWIILISLIIVFFVVISRQDWWQVFLGSLFPNEADVLHPRTTLMVFVWEHLRLVLVSSVITILAAIPLGIFVTRPAGRNFLPIVSDFTSFGQTFPPAAVLALVVPAVNSFGFLPTVIALFLYGLLPIVRNTIAGLNAVPANVLDAARGIGMSRFQALRRIELPLALPVILAGVRVSVIINIGTAMIGAIIGAGGLGSPIIAGLVFDNLAFILEGALPAAMLAVLADQLLANIEKTFSH